MKRFQAILIVLTMIFLCACSGNEANQTQTEIQTGIQITEESTDSEFEITETIKKNKDYITEWNTDLLPEKFPSPPDNAHTFSAIKHKEGEKGEDYSYSTEFVRITFICTEQSFYGFTNELKSLGYNGGSKKIVNGEYYDRDGFKGYWQDGEYYIRIVRSTDTDDNETIFVIDVAPCVDNFPKELEEYFPKFNGYSQSSGKFYGFDVSGNYVDGDYDISDPSVPFWTWEFRFSNGFAGVEQAEFEAYFHEIQATGYEGAISSTSVDGMTVMSGDLIKEGMVADMAVFMLYNVSLKTLDILYTNDKSLVLGDEYIQ